MATVEAFFSERDRDAVRAAVTEVESRTGGEIVPYAVAHSDGHGEAAWSAAFIGALVAAGGAGVLLQFGTFWTLAPALWVALSAIAGGCAGLLVQGFVPAVRRALIPDHALAHRVRTRAMAAFVDEEVFATRDRSGVLIFLSLFERRVEIVADAGITAKVAQAEWDALAADIVAGIRAGRPGEALAAAIRRCGDLLVASGIARRADDRDELPDELRLREE